MNAPMQDEVQSTINAIVGRTVVNGEIGDGGLHLWLDDGRLLVIIGIIAVCEVDGKQLQ